MTLHDRINISQAQRLAHQCLAASARALQGDHPVARRRLASAIQHMLFAAAAAICQDPVARLQHLARAASDARAAHRSLSGLDTDGEYTAACAALDAHQALDACVTSCDPPDPGEVGQSRNRLLSARARLSGVSRGR